MPDHEYIMICGIPFDGIMNLGRVTDSVAAEMVKAGIAVYDTTNDKEGEG
jgi:hypothetical protein